jgi:WD40 repeat protein
LILDYKNNYECLKILDLPFPAKQLGWFGALLPLSNTMFSSYCYDTYNLMIWNIEDDYQCLKTLTERLCSICLIANFLLIGGNKDIKIFDTNNDFQYIDSLKGHDKEITSLLHVKKNQLLLSGSDNAINIWDIAIGFECIKRIEVDNRAFNLVFLRNGYFAVNHEYRVSIWDLVRFVCIGMIDGNKFGVNHLSLMSDARIISFAGDGEAIVWSY